MSEELAGQENSHFQYEVITSPEEREVIKRRALDMVRAAQGADTVIFLDKTARPLSVLFRHLWPLVYPDQERPEIKFVNFGSEKIGVLRDYSVKNLQHKPTKVKEFTDLISSAQDIEKIFGKENTQELLKYLAPPGQQPEKRLIIDESYIAGISQKIAEKIFMIADPKSEYLSFTLIDSPADRKLFSPDGKTPLVTWHSTGTLVDDIFEEESSLVDFKSFKVEPDKYNRQTGFQVRREMRQLAKEIKADIKL